MGKRELLLVILVTVLVAITVSVAFNTFSKGELNPNRSATLQGMYEAIGRSKAYFERPEIQGGGQNSFEEVTLKDLYLKSENGHGIYTISDRTYNSFRLVGRPTNTDIVLEVMVYADSVVWIQR